MPIPDAGCHLPMVALIHYSGDEKDKELVGLMEVFEGDPRDPVIVRRIIMKRAKMGHEDLVQQWKEYLAEITHRD